MGGRLRILSANLCNGAADAEAFARLVAESTPDVVVVQELAPEQADALAERLPHGELAPDRRHTGMGIALRRPGRIGRVSLAGRDARTARLAPGDWPGLGDEVEIVNVHVTAPHMRPVWGTPARRRREVRGILAHVESEPGLTRALIGDFNATPAWPLYRRMAARFEDAALAHARSRGIRAPATWPRRWPCLRIDHCFVRGLCACDSRVVDLPGSDHLGLLMDLALA